MFIVKETLHLLFKKNELLFIGMEFIVYWKKEWEDEIDENL